MRLLSLLFAVILFQSASSQIMFGNRAGYALITQSFETAAGYEGMVIYDDIPLQPGGFSGAAILDIPLHQRWVLGLELGYSERGYILTGVPMFQNRKQVFKAGYAGLGVLPKFRLGTGVQAEFFLGPDIAYRLNLRDETFSHVHTVLEGEMAFQVHRRRADLMREIELSLVGGAGLILPVGAARLHFTARYMHGLSNVYTSTIAFMDMNGYPFGTGRMFNRSVLFSIGYSVPLTAKGWQPVTP